MDESMRERFARHAQERDEARARVREAQARLRTVAVRADREARKAWWLAFALGLIVGLIGLGVSSALAAPPPDPPPGAKGKPKLVWDWYEADVVRADTGEAIPGIYFLCHARADYRECVIYKRYRQTEMAE